MSENNRGSAIIEITLLIPVIFFSVYFYIMSMLYITNNGKAADELSDQLYAEEGDDSVNEVGIETTGERQKQGNIEIIKCNDVFGNYNISFEFRKCADNPVKNLRRWQFVADTIR